ncbi:serine/threonine-protein kinase [Sorangium sp. So ce1182]|uniref:serine/threonine-protein kinase n=1 Tax=Sorangium sp. So ce1182 TaxID=3133334 RepID=UPI003F5F2C45
MLCPRCHRRYADDHRFCPHDGEKLVKSLDIRRLRSQPTEHVGTVVAGRYRVRGLIGSGAMAQVFLAEDTQSGAPVALKLLEPRFRRVPKVKARFLLEAKAAATVVHPNLVEVLDIGLHEESPYLVMEYLAGESLSSMLLRDKRLSPEAGVPILLQAAAGLGAAHRAGIVHRDIKPANVFLVGERGDAWAAKIVDFGFAKLYEHSGLTQAGVTVGTLEYMAPEQTISDPPDARTDIYGFGMLMYRMFAGRLPFSVARSSGASVSPAMEEAMVLANQLMTPAPPPGLGAGPVWRALEAVIMKCLRKRPENRYPSMEALSDDLGRLGRPGALAADAPIASPDVYAAKTPYGEHAARFLYKQLGKVYGAAP